MKHLKVGALKKRKQAHPHLLYRPVMDWWVAVAISGFIAILLACIPLLAWQSTGAVAKLVALTGLVLMVLYLIDLAFFNYYELNEHALVIHSQLRYIVFPYKDMLEVKPSGFRGLISFWGRKRFSLSANSISIRLRRGAWREISISPHDRHQFVNVLLHKLESKLRHED